MKKSAIFVVLTVIFLFCVVGICRWSYTERLYVSMQPSPYTSEQFNGMSKSDKLLMVSSEDAANIQYTREGVYPIDYAPDYTWLVVISAGAGASFTALLSLLLDFYTAGKRSAQKKQNREVVL